MAFAGANNFKIIVGGDFNQREINYHENSAKAMDTIACAACPGACHDSAERADPPKCHPDTRKKVIEEIMKWVNMPDSENRIMWLNGAAGIEKSAIAQTIAEALKNTLISSFSFHELLQVQDEMMEQELFQQSYTILRLGCHKQEV
ncbi:hypothetical protein BDQ17DRAFT_1438539 [Cyathus striatus]|nr:hypothetical protein BDQ17DRAFT_1438539 [Cyathus striatus]